MNNTFIDSLEAATSAGAMVIAGTSNAKALSYIMPASDYAFIGEEIYAASALASQDPVQLNSMRGLEWCKGISLAIVILLFISLVMGRFSFISGLLEV